MWYKGKESAGFENYMSVHAGHDAAFCVYDVKRKKILTLELEKLTDLKHAWWKYNKTKFHKPRLLELDEDQIWPYIQKTLERHGYTTRFEHLIEGSHTGSQRRSKVYSIAENEFPEPFGFLNWSSHPGHHFAHAICALAQCPPDKALVLTMDGGGDDGVGGLWKLDRKARKLELVGYLPKKMSNNLSGHYQQWSTNLLPGVCQNTSLAIDLAGKVMGLSGYGRPPDEETRTALWRKHTKTKTWDLFNILSREETSELYTTYIEELNRLEHQAGDNPQKMLGGSNESDFQREADIAYQIQSESEDLFDLVINDFFPDFKTMLEEHDNQLIFAGGYALNIVNNKRVQEKYDCTVWVPPNPSDCGLAYGQLMWRLHTDNKIDLFTERFDNALEGPMIRDLNMFDAYREHYRATEIIKTDICDMLRQGKIIALMQGQSETGFRALGARSILCDPSIVTKDQVNEIKRREWYRPFAPMCLWEQASKWFDVGPVNNYKHMNMAVDVKPEWRKTLHAITHVDNTARLQAVDQPGFIYDLLKEYNGVLLNTSLNVGGKPICNSMSHALHLLEQTALDSIIIENADGKLWKFDKWKPSETI